MILQPEPGKQFSRKSLFSQFNKSSLVIDKIRHTIRQSNACIAYIYFDYKSGEIQTGDHVVRTLLKQLLLPLDLVPRDLEGVYDECRSRLKDLDKAIFVRQLLSTAAAFSSVYIILDALDECTSGTLEEIIGLLRQFKDRGIKVLCTFRPFLNLRVGLDVSVHSIGAHDEDVRNYLSIRLNKAWPHNKCLRNKIIDRLAEGANGMLIPHPLIY